ncbi:MAG: short-chain fatty acyl-CoA regulator family protein [Paracoccaceae bacterium]
MRRATGGTPRRCRWPASARRWRKPGRTRRRWPPVSGPALPRCCSGWHRCRRRAGAITFRRPPAGFALPRFGAGCPLWPLYEALRRPGEPVRARLEMAGLVPRRFPAFAVAELRGPAGFDAPPPVEATMLVLPDTGPTPARHLPARAPWARPAASAPVPPGRRGASPRSWPGAPEDGRGGALCPPTGRAAGQPPRDTCARMKDRAGRCGGTVGF